MSPVRRPLSQEEKKMIWSAISRNRTPDDRDPTEIIEQDYAGDEDRYLRTMARWHNVPIES